MTRPAGGKQRPVKFWRSVRWVHSLAAQERGAIDLAFALRLAGSGSALGYSTLWKIFFHYHPTRAKRGHENA